MATLTYVVKTPDQDARISNTSRAESLLNAATVFKGLASGTLLGSVDVYKSSDDPVAASGTITLVSCATDTVTIGGVTFTGSATPSGDVQFETDGDDTADAAALAAKINAHPTVSQVVTATSALGVVTVTCVLKGVVGNFITLAETGTTITVSGTALTGGAGGTSGAGSSF